MMGSIRYDVEVAGEAGEIDGIGRVAHEELTVRQRGRAAVGAAIGTADMTAGSTVHDVQGMEIEVVDRPADGAGVDGEFGRIARCLIGPERAIEDAERAGAVRAPRSLKMAAKFLSASSTTSRHLRGSRWCRAARRAGGSRRRRGSCAGGELVEAGRALLGGEDEAAVGIMDG